MGAPATTATANAGSASEGKRAPRVNVIKKIWRRSSKSDVSKGNVKDPSIAGGSCADPTMNDSSSNHKRRGLFRLQKHNSHQPPSHKSKHSSSPERRQSAGGSSVNAGGKKPPRLSLGSNKSPRSASPSSSTPVETTTIKTPVATIVLHEPSTNPAVLMEQQQHRREGSIGAMGMTAIEMKEDITSNPLLSSSSPQKNTPHMNNHNRSKSVGGASDADAPTGATGSPKRDSLFQWQDAMEEREKRQAQARKQLLKERDGFCRSVGSYDGHVLTVEGHAAYELGNYLGGGVAGVVYEGHRLRPVEEYPVRLGRNDSLRNYLSRNDSLVINVQPPQQQQLSDPNKPPVSHIQVQNFLCMAGNCNGAVADDELEMTVDQTQPQSKYPNATEDTLMEDRVSSLLSDDRSLRTNREAIEESQIALEATASNEKQAVIIDTVDAPSRSKHYAKAMLELTEAEMQLQQGIVGENGAVGGDYVPPSDASYTTGGIGRMEETVAIKVLNPVGFRTLNPDVTNTCVVARAGEPLTEEILNGGQPMEDKHVWWLVNPNSRNLRTLQRYNDTSNNAASTRRVEIDRGSPEKGLRISLIAAYSDAEGKLKELPLTRCIEIWGHVPFGASDVEFTQIMQAIDRINQGLPPPPLFRFQSSSMGSLFGGEAQGRVGTGGTHTTSSMSGDTNSVEESLKNTNPFAAKRTGIYRAASTERKTVYCDELKAYIALPAVPSKYLKWLRQRRAATKEIRNMMLIGRHRNVVHLFEVLEFIQETKSTMFLILELVRGGELFDLISSNTAKISSTDKIPRGFTESETVMRKFFQELACGVYYCHSNGIAHRDLKPENLLVHNSRNGECTLKIADFGLSAAFGPNSLSQTDTDTVVESLAPNGSTTSQRFESDISLITSALPPSAQQEPSGPLSPMKERVDKLLSEGRTALSFLTCGAVEDYIPCGPRNSDLDFSESSTFPTPLKRMTSVVGSPHYVAPEIISQNEGSSRRSRSHDTASQAQHQSSGYDGTKADVWSAGVILYAMLFRSLPFGEDLLRCPRYQSFKKWYDEVKTVPNGRRSSVSAPLNPEITEQDERDYLGPHWFFPSHSSPESRDLIVYMLNPDPDMRPTIKLVLQHPWLLKKAD